MEANESCLMYHKPKLLQRNMFYNILLQMWLDNLTSLLENSLEVVSIALCFSVKFNRILKGGGGDSPNHS